MNNDNTDNTHNIKYTDVPLTVFSKNNNDTINTINNDNMRLH